MLPKKWLSLDGLQQIKQTVDEFEELKLMDCSSLFVAALRRHLVATLRKGRWWR